MRQSQKRTERFTSQGKPIRGRPSTQAAAVRGPAGRKEAAPLSSPPHPARLRPAAERGPVGACAARLGRLQAAARPGGVRGVPGSRCPLCAPGGPSGCRRAGRWSIKASCGVRAVRLWAVLSAALTALLCRQERRMRRGLSSNRLRGLTQSARLSVLFVSTLQGCDLKHRSSKTYFLCAVSVLLQRL